jgi:hypothetical protein
MLAVTCEADQETFILPNYDLAYTYRQLYFEVAKSLIRDHHVGMDLLSHTTYNQDALERHVPSWVPRWDLPLAPLSFPLKWPYCSASGEILEASDSLEIIKPTSIFDLYQLRLRARRFGSIDPVDSSMSSLRLLETLSRDPLMKRVRGPRWFSGSSDRP